MLGSAPRKTRSSRMRLLRTQSITMRDIMALACISCVLMLQLLMLLPIASAQPPLWSGMHADASRSNMGRVPGPLAASPVLIRNVSFPTYGKSHGTPAIDSRGRTFVVFWLQGPGSDGTPLLRRWDVDGSVHDVTLPTLGSDIIIDSNDALLLSDAGVAYITFSYYNPSACFNCTSLFAVRTPIPSHAAIVCVTFCACALRRRRHAVVYGLPPIHRRHGDAHIPLLPLPIAAGPLLAIAAIAHVRRFHWQAVRLHSPLRFYILSLLNGRLK
jgi:hypothetical protein